MNPLALGGIIKQFYDDFNMNSFENRLKIQKILYLMKAKGLSMGYTFNLYLYGPYCSDLTRDAFQIAETKPWDQIEKITFTEEVQKTAFNAFIEKLNHNDRKNDIVWLEIAASYVFLKANRAGLADNEIIAIIQNKRTGFDIPVAKMNEIITEMKAEGYFV